MDAKNLERMAAGLKKGLKEAHQNVMAMVPPEERSALKAKMDKMISDANKSEKHPFMKDFMKEIYGR